MSYEKKYIKYKTKYYNMKYLFSPQKDIPKKLDDADDGYSRLISSEVISFEKAKHIVYDNDNDYKYIFLNYNSNNIFYYHNAIIINYIINICNIYTDNIQSNHEMYLKVNNMATDNLIKANIKNKNMQDDIYTFINNFSTIIKDIKYNITYKKNIKLLFNLIHEKKLLLKLFIYNIKKPSIKYVKVTKITPLERNPTIKGICRYRYIIEAEN